MSDKESKSIDVLGIKPVADAFSHVTKAAVDGASAFLGRICLPAAEELGLLFRDKVRAWRAKNAVAVIAEAEARYEKYQAGRVAQAHPRLVASVVEHSSWTDDRTLQQMWGGLLASSCSPDGRDESNLIFINLLSQLTSLQVRVLSYACSNVKKLVTPEGLIMPDRGLYVEISTVKGIANTDDIHRLDTELDHLHGLGLITGGFQGRSTHVDICPTALALNLFVRSQGFTGSAVAFFNLIPPIVKT
jgi:Abortive infection alpha